MLRTAMTVLLVLCLVNHSFPQEKSKNQIVEDGTEFIDWYNSLYQVMYAATSQAYWLSSTDVTEEHTGGRIGADQDFLYFRATPTF